MQKTKKQLLGFVGLVVVGVMTAIACAIPAAAAEEVSYSDSSTDVTVYVGSGVEEANTAKITKPKDRSMVIDPELTVSYNYEGTKNVKTYIKYKDAAGNWVGPFEIDDFTPTEKNGTRTFEVDLNQYGGREQEYTIFTRATNQEGTPQEDYTTFFYRAVSAELAKKPAANGDPILNAEVNGEVQQILVNVYDNHGDPLFVNSKGEQVPIVLTRDDIDPATGKITKVLPFASYNAKDGTYTVVISAYNGKSEEGATLISMVTLDTVYTHIKETDPGQPEDPNLPETPPNTGFVIGDLNISKLDYLVTGLIVFGLVASFALFLVYRKSRR